MELHLNREYVRNTIIPNRTKASLQRMPLEKQNIILGIILEKIIINAKETFRRHASNFTETTPPHTLKSEDVKTERYVGILEKSSLTIDIDSEVINDVWIPLQLSIDSEHESLLGLVSAIKTKNQTLKKIRSVVRKESEILRAVHTMREVQDFFKDR